MFNNKSRRRRYRSNGRSFHRRNNNDGQRNGTSLFTNGQNRVPPLRGGQNIYKLVEKYKDLAKEALSSGDKILSENYFQHADHFSRIISDNNIKNNNNSPSNSTSTKNLQDQDEAVDSNKKDNELEKV